MTPESIGQWSMALGVSPLTVMLGAAVWALVWRAHRQLVLELRHLRTAIESLVRCVNGPDDPPDAPRRRHGD